MHCMLSYFRGHPILYVSHDEDDGMWQFLCGSNHNIEDASIVSLFEVYNIDYSICLLKRHATRLLCNKRKCRK